MPASQIVIRSDTHLLPEASALLPNPGTNYTLGLLPRRSNTAAAVPDPDPVTAEERLSRGIMPALALSPKRYLFMFDHRLVDRSTQLNYSSQQN